MAKIVIDKLPKVNNPAKSFTYADLHLDLQSSYLVNGQMHAQPEVKDLKIDYDIDAVKNAIKNIYMTAPGDKILNPTFGLDLRQFLFEQLTVDRSIDIQHLIYTKLPRMDSRIVNRFVQVTLDPDKHEYHIFHALDIPSLNIANVSLFGVLNTNGYTFH